MFASSFKPSSVFNREDFQAEEIVYGEDLEALLSNYAPINNPTLFGLTTTDDLLSAGPITCNVLTTSNNINMSADQGVVWPSLGGLTCNATGDITVTGERLILPKGVISTMTALQFTAPYTMTLSAAQFVSCAYVITDAPASLTLPLANDVYNNSKMTIINSSDHPLVIYAAATNTMRVPSAVWPAVSVFTTPTSTTLSAGQVVTIAKTGSTTVWGFCRALL